MRLIDADAIPWFVEGIGEIPVITKEEIDEMPTVDAVPVVRCRECKHFETDHFENVSSVPLILAHNICKRWGDGCKTDPNGYCFLAKRRTDETD